MKRYASLVSTGITLPPAEITNAELKRRLPKAAEFVDKMEGRSGIKTRFWSEEGVTTSDLALQASLNALEAAQIGPDEVDLIILGTDSPDYITPATSVVLQHKLKAKNAGTFDVGCACASFPTGFSIASGLMAVNPYINNVLLVGVYLMHRLAPPDDPAVFFYGDGAGAAVLQPKETPGFISSSFQADGTYNSFWGIYAGGTVEPASAEALEAGRTQVRITDRYPPEVNLTGWPKVVRDLAERGGFALEEIDQIVFTQVNLSTIDAVMDDLKLPMDRAHTVMQKWGYTGSACIPMALHDAIEAGKIGKNQLVVLVGSGVGYNQAGVAFRTTS